jgi:hypothetical protein
VPLRRERAARLRDAGRHAARRFFDAQVGQTITVLTENHDTGHSEHFAPVRLSAPVEAGRLIAARVAEATHEGLWVENLSRCEGEVETRNGKDESDRAGTHFLHAACRPDHPHPAPRAALSRVAGEA